jgi:hypothetical protein
VARTERDAVFWLDRIERVKFIMPAPGKRLSLLAFAAVLGIFAGYSLPGAAGWFYGAPAVLLLALIAGVSALWSP